MPCPGRGHQPPMRPRIGSLCTGYGGLDIAAHNVFGGTLAWVAQYEPPHKGKPDRHQYAARILAHRWPRVPNLGNLETADWDAIEHPDILTAGFPCTDLSYAGHGAGIVEGTRSGLWFAITRAVCALRPRLLILENVRAIVGRRPGLDVVLAGLAALRFDARWACVKASGVGAPHPRERWFCLAWPSAENPDVESCDQWRFPASGQAEGGRAWADARRRGRAPAADSESERYGNAGPASVAGVPAAPVASDQSGDVGWGAYAEAIARWETILGRPAPRPVDDSGRLAPEFAEWMMGLPDGWVTDVPAPAGMRAAGLRNARLKALGNGVVPQQAEYAIRLLLGEAEDQAVV